MPRKPRFILPGCPQHIIQRGNNRTVIFVDDADYLFYLNKLHEACERYECSVHAYVLMTNHVHFLMTPAQATGISKVMQSLGRCYVQYFNWRYRRTGTLWEGRYKASMLDTECYLLTCYRYIELNPVRAVMVNHPQDYRWSSYRYNANGDADRYITPHAFYLQLGKDRKDQCKAYRALFEHCIGCGELKVIRDATNGDWVIGNERFQNEVERLQQRQAAPKARGGDRKSDIFARKSGIDRL